MATMATASLPAGKVARVLLPVLAAAACAWVAVGAWGGGGAVVLAARARGPQAEARAIASDEQAGADYAHMASQFRQAEQVAAQELADAHRKGPVDTLRTASERLDVARAGLSDSAADQAALLRLSGALRAYSQALIRNKDGLEFESPGAYKQLSSFEIKHPSLARIPAPRVSASAAADAQEAQRPDRAARARRAASRRPVADHRAGTRWQHQGAPAAPVSQLARDVALARREMSELAAEGGPRQPSFPAFAGRAVKGFPYNVMGNLMSAVNAV